ncbi:hypothetical protein ACLOJK_003380, partial [Asimina triloba]
MVLNATSCPFLSDVPAGGFSSSTSYVIRTPHSMPTSPDSANLSKKNKNFQFLLESKRFPTALEFPLFTKEEEEENGKTRAQAHNESLNTKNAKSRKQAYLRGVVAA